MKTLADTLRALAEGADPAPWHASGGAWNTSIGSATADICEIGEYWPTEDMREAIATAALIVALRNALPEILNALDQHDALTARVAELEAAVRQYRNDLMFPAAAALTACRTCKGRGGVQEDIGDGQYVGAECPVCCGHGFSEDIEDGVWSAIMEAQGPDSNARDYAKAALLYLARDAIAALINPSPLDREALLEQCAQVADASAKRLMPHETSDENSQSLQAACKMARAEAESIARKIRALHPVEPQDVQTGGVEHLAEQRRREIARMRGIAHSWRRPALAQIEGQNDLKIYGGTIADDIDLWAEMLAATPTPAPADGALREDQRYLSNRFKWAAPGDQQEDAWLVRFCDKDCGEAIFTGPEAERDAWEHWNRYAPSYNIYVFRLAALSTPDQPRGDALAVERDRAIILHALRDGVPALRSDFLAEHGERFADQFDAMTNNGQLVGCFPEAKRGDSERQFWRVALVDQSQGKGAGS